MYEAIRVKGKTLGVRRIADGLEIPLSPTNRHYREFLAHQEKQQELGLPVLDLTDKQPDPPTAAEQRVIDAKARLKARFKDLPAGDVKDILIVLNAVE